MAQSIGEKLRLEREARGISLREISEQMSQPEVARDAVRLIGLDKDYRETEARLASLYEKWDEAVAQS